MKEKKLHPASPAGEGNAGAGISDGPSHHHHEGEAEKEEKQAGDAVLNSDDLVVGGKNVFFPKTEFVLIVVRSILPVLVLCFVAFWLHGLCDYFSADRPQLHPELFRRASKIAGSYSVNGNWFR